MGTKKENILHGARIKETDSGREGIYLYTNTIDVGGLLMTQMYAEFDDNEGMEEEIYPDDFEIIGEVDA